MVARAPQSGLLRMLAAIVLATAAYPVSGQSPVIEGDSTLQLRMEQFAKAREFGDPRILTELLSPDVLNRTRSNVQARYDQFRRRFPDGKPAKDNADFRNFIHDLLPGASDADTENVATAFALIEAGNIEEAVFTILGYSYMFPTRGVSIKSSSHSLARAAERNAVYYLSEEWLVIIAEAVVPKRFVVEWVRAPDGSWQLEAIR